MGKIFWLQTDSVQSGLVVAERLRGAVALRVDVRCGRGRVLGPLLLGRARHPEAESLTGGGHHGIARVELDVGHGVGVLPGEDPDLLPGVCPPEVKSPVSGARDHELTVWGEAGLYVYPLVVLVSRQCEHWFSLEGLQYPDYGPVSCEHHQLAVKTKFDSSPVTARLYLVLEGGERSLVEAPHIVQFDLLTLNRHGKYQPLGVKAGHRSALK